MNKPFFKCHICDRVINLNEFGKGNVDVEFISNDRLTTEKLLYIHKDCRKPKRRSYETIYSLKW